MNIGRAVGIHVLTSRALESGKGFSATGLFETTLFYALLATIALFSIPYGAVSTSNKSLLILIVSVIAIFRIVESLTRRSFCVAEPRLLSPLFAVLGLAFIQTVRWPGTTSAISVDPFETRTFILIFGALIVAAEVLFSYTTTTDRLQGLIVLVITVGTGSAVFGLLREFYFDSRSEWLTTYLFPEQGFAQFINRNHFALLIEMAFGLLLGILIKGELSEKLKFAGWVVAAIMGYSAIAANSRGGLVSLAAIVLFAVMFHMLTRESKGSSERAYFRRDPPAALGTLFRKLSVTAGVVALVSVMIVFMIAFVGGDSVVTRIEKLKGEFETVNNAGVNRNLIWNSTLQMIESKPLLGVGFGAYATAIPKFDTSGGRYRVQQAHNDYLEILSNGGIVGFALFTLFGAIVVRRTSKNLRSANSLRQASCFGAAIGILGVVIHSFVDFGLHIPVNAFIFAVLIVIATVNIQETATRI